MKKLLDKVGRIGFWICTVPLLFYGVKAVLILLGERATKEGDASVALALFWFGFWGSCLGLIQYRGTFKGAALWSWLSFLGATLACVAAVIVFVEQRQFTDLGLAFVASALGMWQMANQICDLG